MRTIIIFLILTNHSLSQENWILYNKDNSPLPSNMITSVVQDKDEIYWITTLPEINNMSGGGIAKFHNGNWEIFTAENSPLPTNRISWGAVDSLNNKWFGTYDEGIIRYNSGEWHVFNNSNSGLHSNDIYQISVGKNNTLWIATYSEGIAKYDGESWQIFRQSDFDLPSEKMNFVFPDKDTIWAGTDYGGLIFYTKGIWHHFGTGNYSPGFNFSVMSLTKDQEGFFWSNAFKTNTGALLIKFIGSEIVYFDSSLTGFNSKYGYHSIGVDISNNKWIGTNDGLLLYNNNEWIKYNSPYSNNSFSFIYIDNYNNKITGSNGLLFFNENGITSAQNEYPVTSFELMQNYPNPFNPATKIKFTIPANIEGFENSRQTATTLRVYDILGIEIATLINEPKEPGPYEVEFNISNLSSGVYLYTLRSGGFISSKKMLLIK